MKLHLEQDEKVVADQGYLDETCSALDVETSHLWGDVRALHECVNKRIKQFAVLTRRFRHNRSLHSICAHACINVTQICIENGQPVFNS